MCSAGYSPCGFTCMRLLAEIGLKILCVNWCNAARSKAKYKVGGDIFHYIYNYFVGRFIFEKGTQTNNC